MPTINEGINTNTTLLREVKYDPYHGFVYLNNGQVVQRFENQMDGAYLQPIDSLKRIKIISEYKCNNTLIYEVEKNIFDEANMVYVSIVREDMHDNTHDEVKFIARDEAYIESFLESMESHGYHISQIVKEDAGKVFVLPSEFEY